MSETNQTERPVRRPRVLMVSLKENEVEAMCKGYHLHLTRDSEDDNWYIQVTDRRGCKAYDGWWRDSAGRVPRDAISEALRGSCLWTSNAMHTAITDQDMKGVCDEVAKK